MAGLHGNLETTVVLLEGLKTAIGRQAILHGAIIIDVIIAGDRIMVQLHATKISPNLLYDQTLAADPNNRTLWLHKVGLSGVSNNT